MMWNTCEWLHAVKQQKYKGGLLFCLFKIFTVSVLFTSSLRIRSNCHLFSLVNSGDEIKATKVIAYTTWSVSPFNYHADAFIEKGGRGKGSIFSTVAALSKPLIRL